MTTVEPAPNPPRDSCSIAFKEWAGVVAAVRAGRQSILLRKGGIDEGPGGFRPEHAAFWLYPTAVHQAEQGLKSPWDVANPPTEPGIVPLDVLVVVGRVARLDDLDALLALDDQHAWTEATVRKRFAYRSPGLWALEIRAFRRETPWPVAITPLQLGCKTWVELESPPPAGGLRPIEPLDSARVGLERPARAGS